MPQFVPLSEIDDAAVEHLLDRAFGTDRHARTAYKVREGTAPIAALSLALVEDGALLGTIQCWPVALAGDDGRAWPLVMVGPVAIDPPRQQHGLGHLLMEKMLAAAAAIGASERLMLVGDPEYYGRFFGFTADRTGQWRLPGPVERHRLLARGADIPDRPGLLGPRFC
ncbi:putative N-acetyltransferase YhbS [Hephaestia caeni]|uniref:Putative N-acetyltransferase YhbS n=1 Tax=Hephaestia caeni TaxID=645617 RepID=A0A397P8V8_9SPHN|nr:N-acetyltransferase [Hephaestia caeni]RIA43607.1 putative N-acetyltransferase YhbS [Hephaestia caeni]